MVLVMAVLGDKAWPEMLDMLLPKTDAAILTVAPPRRRTGGGIPVWQPSTSCGRPVDDAAHHS